MYRRLVARRVTAMFDALTHGDYQTVVAGLAHEVHHSFAGDHALGGERRDRAAVEQWFGRLSRLVPDLRFTVHRVISQGLPWSLLVAVEWTAVARPAAGDPYVNHGAHIIRIERFRVTELHAYEDSQVVERACRQMIEAGISEAGADPIES